MQGHVPTPAPIVDRMVQQLFRHRPPRHSDTILDPGCGDGAFLLGVKRFCNKARLPLPRLIGVEIETRLVEAARENLGPEAIILEDDFLFLNHAPVDFVIGNPPYVSIIEVPRKLRTKYRAAYPVAQGRFDLYHLFFDRALALLREGGRLVFITPEKYQYVESTAALRATLAAKHVERIEFQDPASFPGRITYPVITTINNALGGRTEIVGRGRRRFVRLPIGGESWNGVIREQPESNSSLTLKDVCERISCGVATGFDKAYVVKNKGLLAALRPFARLTVSGRQINGKIRIEDSLLCPYDKDGNLLPESRLGALKDYFESGSHDKRLRKRTCVERGGKEWYAFHDSFPIKDLVRPKILCKDICAAPRFWMDKAGEIVPRHSVYYLIPKNGVNLESLATYLNSAPAKEWLKANSQSAAQGYLRLQSHVLKRLPIPRRLSPPGPLAETGQP